MIDDAKRGPGRPRDPQVDEAILEATLAVLLRRGWSGTTMEEIAEEAGVGKPSIYRRYPSKIDLAYHAASRERDLSFPGFDTGTAWGDLTAFVLGTLRMLNSVWSRVLPAIFAEAADDPEVGSTVERYWGWRRGAISVILERGIERREVRPDADPEIVLEAVDGPMLVRLLVTRKPLDMEFADNLVENVMIALAARGP
jgi:AcrR family transcriptional regulator